MLVSRAVGLNREEIKATGDVTLAVLDQIPLTSMINGGCNGLVGAFVYSAINEAGTNDVLIVTMSGEQGDLTYLFVTDLDEYSNCVSKTPGSRWGVVPCLLFLERMAAL